MSTETPCILVLDRESSSVSELVAELVQLGYRVVAGATSEEGLGFVQQARPDVVIADLGMPEISGTCNWFCPPRTS